MTQAAPTLRENFRTYLKEGGLTNAAIGEQLARRSTSEQYPRSTPSPIRYTSRPRTPRR